MSEHPQKNLDELAAARRENAARLAAQRRSGCCTDLAMPVHLTVANTNRCNLRCPMCIRQELPRGDWQHSERDVQLFKRLAEETFPFLKRLALSVSGEPFASTWFADLLSVVEAYHVPLEITTNGTLFPDDALLERLVRCLASVTVSVDAATPARYAALRVGARLDQVSSNIARLDHFRRRLATADRPSLGIACVLMRSNIEELPALIQWAGNLGCDHVGAAHLVRHRPDFPEQSLSSFPEIARKKAAEAQEVAKRCNIALHLPDDLQDPVSRSAEPPTLKMPLPDAPQIRCHLPWERAWVEYDGTVAACCSPDPRRPILGNLNSSSFREIWNGENYRRLREQLASEDLSPVCRDCTVAVPPPILKA